MDTINNIIHSEYFPIAITIFNIILLILYMVNARRLGKINKSYKTLIRKLGNGSDIEEILRTYISKVEDVNEKHEELVKFCHRLDQDLSLCIRKVGMIRYSAYNDAGSDLSFALALLNDNNDGVVLNGIYSREMSNIYAKKIQKGKSNNNLTEEEIKAIDIACKSGKMEKQA